MRKTLIQSIIIIAVLSGCGGGGRTTPVTEFGSPNTSATRNAGTLVPIAGRSITLTGQVIRLNDQLPAPGVQVQLGCTQLVATTDSKGLFRIALPPGTTVAFVLNSSPRIFSLTIPSKKLTSVVYQGALYPAAQVPIPPEVLSGRTTELGIINILDSPISDTDDVPPPPPMFYGS